MDIAGSVRDPLADVDSATRRRLQRCLPRLSEASASWDAQAAPEDLLILAATPRRAVVMAADGWPDPTRSSTASAGGLPILLVPARAGYGDAARGWSLCPQERTCPLESSFVDPDPRRHGSDPARRSCATA